MARIRAGEETAWAELISRYEGRLLAFAQSRLGDRTAAEDVVQEAFLGFLLSLPNYDPATPLESFLFSITAHKLTDALRRNGRRPALPLFFPEDDGHTAEPAGSARRASSILQSAEGKAAEQAVIAGCLRELIDAWKTKGEWERLMCVELLFVAGLPNKDAAAQLKIDPQTVANHKAFVVGKLKEAATQARLRQFDAESL